jgi:hypothetical protein
MTNDPGAALSLLCLGTGLGLPAQAVHCFAAHPARSGMPFSGNRLRRNGLVIRGAPGWSVGVVQTGIRRTTGIANEVAAGIRDSLEVLRSEESDPPTFPAEGLEAVIGIASGFESSGEGEHCVYRVHVWNYNNSGEHGVYVG